MVLYGRFSISAEITPSLRTCTAEDRLTGRSVVLYRDTVSPARLAKRWSEADAILRPWQTAPLEAVSQPDLFTTPGSLWLVASDQAVVEPMLSKLREAGLFLPAEPPKAPPLPPKPPSQPEVKPADPIPWPVQRPPVSTQIPAPPPPKTVHEGKGKSVAFVLAVVFVCLGLVLLVAHWSSTSTKQGAGSVSTALPVQPSAPEIQSFNASARDVEKGGNVTLYWQTVNANSVQIKPSVGTVSSDGRTSVSLQEDTTFTLQATGDGGTRSRSVTVRVRAEEAIVPPVVVPSQPIVSPAPAAAPVVQFSSDAASPVAPNTVLSLRWSVENATSVTLTPDVGPVSLSGERQVRVDRAVIYTLTATGSGGTVKQQLAFDIVTPKPTVTLTMNKRSFQVGETARVCWSTTNATSVALSNASRSMTGCFDRRFDTPGAFHYTALAIGPGGETTATFEFQVSDTPSASFPQSNSAQTEPKEVAAGDVIWSGEPNPFTHNVTITWNFVPATPHSLAVWEAASGDGAINVIGKNPSLYALRLTNGDITFPDGNATLEEMKFDPLHKPITFKIKFHCNHGGPQTVRLHWSTLR